MEAVDFLFSRSSHVVKLYCEFLLKNNRPLHRGSHSHPKASPHGYFYPKRKLKNQNPKRNTSDSYTRRKQQRQLSEEETV
ncbi:unnamed protein product [Sphenostylis stenocarpa]|uniref:Uncharacterized protein n=1 Tax=Sphenostylis stenocarpa TaxID=92480 RepID=A0AA86SWC9_9FABA|nr:unnamed protein product [Sphenostylis stenocarpa]